MILGLGDLPEPEGACCLRVRKEPVGIGLPEPIAPVHPELWFDTASAMYAATELHLLHARGPESEAAAPLPTLFAPGRDPLG